MRGGWCRLWGYPMVGLATPGKMTEATFFRHTYSAEWEEAVGKDRLLDEDISTELLLRGQEEIFWNDDPDSYDASPANRRLHQLENDLGMIWGQTLLLSHHSRNPVSSGIGLHIGHVRSDTEFFRYWKEHETSLRAVAEMLNSGMLQQHKDGVVRLSGREKDYIYWSALGLDRVQIADRLCISANTLNKPIASAKAKLKARNTSQAVAKAVLLGLVEL
ncbi:helix-turn-helix transcriptional regulator [Shimia sp.]|uniref:helix-turn-helix transcriptional regulator n=2 Tax=unclassified Shimia TaxID=2630038 RepID=UPI0025FB12AC|nr:helix-turn-helix transcriptional regulator [Shimia sp.]